jgi:hypothetical protein
MKVDAIYNLISPWFRRRRLLRFAEALAPDRDKRILDVGGTPWMWEELNGYQITLLNPAPITPSRQEDERFTFLKGDGCILPFADRSFEIVFSNSVIEHVGTWARQQAFAAEARRVGRLLWIQTPAREFFIEPHLIAPFVHWLPKPWQRRLIRNCTIRGWFDRPDRAAVDSFLAEVRLLTFSEMEALFPDCRILRERFLGLTKSYIAIRTAS